MELNFFSMLQFIIYFSLVVISATVVWWLYFTSTKFYKLCKKIPGPTPLPIIGNIELMKDTSTFAKNLLNVFQKYQPISKVFIGTICFVGLLDPDDIHTLLNGTKAVSKFKLYTAFRFVIGENMLTAPREEWKTYRRIWNPAFGTQVIRNFIPIFNEKCNVLIQHFKLKKDILEFDIYDNLSVLTADTILETISGINFKIQENETDEVNSVLQSGKILIQEVVKSPIHWLKFVFNHSNYSKRASQILKADQKFMEPILIKYNNIVSKTKTNNNMDFEQKKNWRMINHIIEFLSKKGKLEGNDILDQVRLIGIAGTDTTAFTLSVCFKLLGLHKDVQDKVVEELQKIFHNDICRPAEYDDLQKMIYTEQVIKETLRLFPVAFLTGRRVDEEIKIGQYLLPVGTDVIFSPLLLHRDPKYYVDPLKFDPERFSPENISARHPHCFIPFLNGPRNCIGHYYAMLQMKTILANVLRHFEFLPCGSREEMEDIDMEMLLSLKHGYKVRMKLR